jgi:hypothetical protein
LRRYESFWHTTKSTTQGCIYYILYLCLGYKWQTLFLKLNCVFFFLKKKMKKISFSCFLRKKNDLLPSRPLSSSIGNFLGPILYMKDIYIYTSCYF